MEVFVKGIDFSLPGNGGPECAKYLSAPRQVIEFLAGVTVSLSSLGTFYLNSYFRKVIFAQSRCYFLN